MNCKFLFVSSYDLKRNTSSNIRTIALMKALHSKGCIVDVAYIPSTKPQDKQISDTLIDSVDKLIELIDVKLVDSTQVNTIKKEPSLKDRFKKMALKIYNKIFVYDVFQLNIKKIKKSALDKIDTDYDYVVSSSEPRSSHKLARAIIRKKKLLSKWILYWGDPMTNDVASKKVFPWMEKKVEKSLIKKSDLSLYTNPGCVEYMKTKYEVLKNKIDWIPTSDLLEYVDKGVSIYDVSYIGDYVSSYRNIYPLYNVLCNLDVKSAIIGDSDIKLPFSKNIFLSSRVSKSKADEVENASKILVVLDNDSRKGQCIQVPGKLYHYALTNKYVMVVSDSSLLEKYYGHYNRFIFVKNDANSINNTIEKILADNYPESYKKPLSFFENDNISNIFLEKVKYENKN